MMNAPGHAYHVMRAALEQFARLPSALDAGEREQADALARRTAFIEARILASQEGQGVRLQQGAVAAARAQLAARYDTEAAFMAELEQAELDEASLAQALERQLIAEAALEVVDGCVPRPDVAQQRSFYDRNPARFTAPEQRQARHLLITINQDFPENRPHAAKARMAAIAARLAIMPQRFPGEAKAHSECPTALQGGAMGWVTRGQLMPALEAALFTADEGAFTRVIETELGLHLLLCERVQPARKITFEDAAEKIEAALWQAAREQARRTWLKQLSRPAAKMQTDKAPPAEAAQSGLAETEMAETELAETEAAEREPVETEPVEKEMAQCPA